MSTDKNSGKLAAFEPRDDGTVLIRGRDLGMLGQFAWAVFVPAGIVVPAEKLPLARQALDAMGYRITDATTPPRATGGNIRTARDWPECANCRAPWLRRTDPEPGEHCTSCGQPLRLVMPADRERAERRREEPEPRCTRCQRRVDPRRQNYCRCGQPVPEPAGVTRARPITELLRPDMWSLPADVDEDQP